METFVKEYTSMALTASASGSFGYSFELEAACETPQAQETPSQGTAAPAKPLGRRTSTTSTTTSSSPRRRRPLALHCQWHWQCHWWHSGIEST